MGDSKPNAGVPQTPTPGYSDNKSRKTFIKNLLGTKRCLFRKFDKLLGTKRGLFRVWLQPMALGVAACPFSRLAPAFGSGRRSLAFFASGSILWLSASKLGLFCVWRQPLALGFEAWPYSRLAPASGSWRRSLCFCEIFRRKLSSCFARKFKFKFDRKSFPNVTLYVLLKVFTRKCSSRFARKE